MSSEADSAFDQHLRTFFIAMASLKENPHFSEREVDEFRFHVHECLPDLRDLLELRDNPNRYSQDEAERIMQAILYHSLSHLLAAARLYDEVVDVFK